jgi:tetratricopeptide (TPR) repeat protein
MKFNRLFIGLLSGWLLAAGLQAQSSPRETIDQLLNSARRSLSSNQLERAESDLRRVLGISLEQLGAASVALEDFQQGERAHQESYQAAIASAPLLGLGIIYLRTGRYDEAIREVNKILTLDLNHAEARHLLGKIHFMRGEFELAAQELGRAYSTEPDNVAVAYTLALSLLKLRRQAPAERIFDQMKAGLGETPQLYVLIGRAYREFNYLAEATAAFKRATELDSRYPRAHYYLGMTYLLHHGASYFEEASEAFEAELRIDPDSFYARFFLGVLNVIARNFQEAIFHLEKAVTTAPDNPDPNMYLGQALFQDGRAAEAIPYLRRSVELTTDISRNSYQVGTAHYMLAQSLRRTGDAEEAQKHFRLSQEIKSEKSRAQVNPSLMQGGGAGMGGGMGGDEIAELALSSEPAVILHYDPPDPETRELLERAVEYYRSVAASAYQQLAQLETMRGDFSRASTHLTRLIGWDSAFPGAHFNLGLALLRSGRETDAVSPLIKALKENPSRTETQSLLAALTLALMDKNQLDPALETSAALLQHHPEVADLYLLRGRILAKRGRWDDALRELRTALEKNPSIPDAHYYCGAVLIRQGELDKAREAFDKELALDPRHVRAIYHKAFVLSLQREMDEALPLLETAIRLKPDYAEPYYQLGKAQLEQEKNIQALGNLETAANLQPHSSYIFYQLSRAYLKSGRRDDAQKAMTRYQELKRREQQNRLPQPVATPEDLPEM